MPFTKTVKGGRRGRGEEGEKERKRQKDFTRYKECCCSIAMCVGLFVTPWTVALQAPLPTGFPGQEYWSGGPFPSY